MLRKQISLLLALALAFALSACGGGQPSEGSEVSGWTRYAFQDASGAEVILDKRPERVAVLFSSFADIWLTAGGRVDITVGESVERGLVPDGTPLVDDGAGKTINSELLLSYAPDFVIGSADLEGQIQTVEFLRRQGVPAAVFHVETFGDYLEMLKICTDITGDAEAYKDNGTEVAEDIDAIKKKAEGKSAGSVAVLTTYSGGTRVQASSTQTGTMLAELGASNITDADKSLLSDYSLESLVKADPDFIFLLPMGDSSEAAQKALKDQTTANPAWKELTAVKEGRVITLNPKLFLYKPNDNWDDAYEELYEALYETPREQK